MSYFKIIFLLCLYVLIPAAIFAQTASITTPNEVVIGSRVDITWTGPGEQYDSIYVLKPTEPDSASGINKASIISGKNPVALVMPEEPGVFELRYWSRTDTAVIARKAIKVIDVETSINAPESAQVGEKISVDWKGPGNSYEQVGLYDIGAPHNSKALASIGILGKSPVYLHLPENSGEFELRYTTRTLKRVLASRKITISDIAASIDAPKNAGIGETIEISWVGPGNQYDVIALYTKDSDENQKAVASSSIISKKNPIQMHLPEKAGEYELRYQLRQTGKILATRLLTIGAVAASLDAPERAVANTKIDVSWEGPGNNYDQIVVFHPSSAEVVSEAAILNKRNPIPLVMPDMEGEFELRYITRQEKDVLATKSIVVEPAGKLAVVFERNSEVSASQGTGAILLILDASGSMLKRDIAGKRRIDVAREVLDELVNEYLSQEQQFALRVFGHKEANSCRTELEIPLQPLDRKSATSRISAVNAINLAKTPIADSLALAPNDLAGANGPKSIILLTDGEETCDGDPVSVIKNLRGLGIDIQISIVGFAIADLELKETFRSWAELGGGSYFDAQSAEDLRLSLRRVISGPFKVFDAKGQLAGQGVVGGAQIILPAGTYRVETVGKTPMVIENVNIKPRELTTASF